jgi:hypothetical protein
MIKRLPIDLIVEIGILAGPDEYEELAKTSERNAIILQKPYIVKATNELIVKKTCDSEYLCDPVYFYYYQGTLHSFNDQPACIWLDGTKLWYQHGKRHRDNDQPAIIYSSGTREWCQYGYNHRDNDQPAIIYSDGKQQWYQRGKFIK